MTSHPTRLLNVASGEIVDAVLHDELSSDDLKEVHLAWQPVRLGALKRLPKDKWPEHWHWDWSHKADKLKLLAHRCFGIACAGQMQGLMLVSTIARKARAASEAGKATLYIEYIETAPWNLKLLTDKPRFAGVGVALLEAAVAFSISEEYHGRIGLHSLPQAEPFYGRYMMDLGVDGKHSEELRYFEMTPTQAQAFLEGREL